MKIINYIAEINLPSKSAYSIQVMKMCDAFFLEGYQTKLFIFCKKGKNIHKSYNCKKKFQIKDFKINSNTFLSRLIFGLKIIIKKKRFIDKEIFYSRSIIVALILAFINKNIILEIHHELKGISRFLFNFSKKFSFFKNLKIVFISENLKKYFKLKNKSIVLDDAVDYENYSNLKKYKKYKNTCVYAGSFSKGKGLETIVKIAKKLPKIKFHIFGDFVNSCITKTELQNYKNIIYKGYVKYKEIPKILSLYKVYLMPYSKKVFVRSKNIEVGNYMSPLKLFEYLASPGVLFASDMPVYRHILNNNNSIIIKENSVNEWVKKIDEFFDNSFKFNNLSKNATLLAKENTWQNRVKKIKVFINANS